MVFVTVGTHEQPFDRLVKEVDHLAESGEISDVLIQTGYCTYRPRFAAFKQWLSSEEMEEMTERADILITHGGPSSFLAGVRKGKIPVVVPRLKEFGEHVNNHQAEFAEKVEERYHNIIVVSDIRDLGRVIKHYDEITAAMPQGIESNNAAFIRKFEEIIDGMFRKAGQ